MTEVSFILGGALFAYLGLIHALFNFLDIRHPRRLVPDDQSVLDAMSASGVRLSRGGTTMWRAWVGFNFSHSLGAVVFGSCCILLGISSQTLALPRAVLILPVAIGALYFWLALRYWFRAPAVAIALATACLLVGWLAY